MIKNPLSNYETVYWSPWVKTIRPEMKPLIEPLKVLIKDPVPILKLINKDADYMYMEGPLGKGSSCPAVVDFLSQIYVIRAAFDFELRLNEYGDAIKHTGPKLSNDGSTNNIIGFSRSPFSWDRPYCFTSPPGYVFYADGDVDVEVLPLMLINSDATKNIATVPASFNIGKWIRPLDFTFDILDPNVPVIIKEDDPIFCVRLRSNTGKKIKLEKKELTQEIDDAVSLCVNLKEYKTRLPLAKGYSLVKNYISKLSFKKKGKCPFHR
jgi:hypothetical protein